MSVAFWSKFNQERNEDYNNFLQIFDRKLPTFGSYFDSDFTSLIPHKIQEYTIERDLAIARETAESESSSESVEGE